MLTLKWKFFNNPIVGQALHKLASANGLTAETSYKIGRFCEKIDKEMEKARLECMKLMNKYCKKDENGKILGFPNGPFQFIEDGDEDRHDKEFLVLMETEFSDKINKIRLSDLNGANLTPKEVIAIEDILDINDEKALEVI